MGAPSDRDYCIARDLAGSPPSSPAPNVEDSNATGHQLRLRDEECSRTNPCDRCQGDCDDDDQCRGAELVCFQRTDTNIDSSVPGCEGDAVTSKCTMSRCFAFDGSCLCSLLTFLCSLARDYCVTKDMNGASQSLPVAAPLSAYTSIPLSTNIRSCSATKRCNRCEGDCDSDQDCMPGLKCFVKDGPGEISGCVGHDKSKTDYCYLP